MKQAGVDGAGGFDEGDGNGPGNGHANVVAGVGHAFHQIHEPVG